MNTVNQEMTSHTRIIEKSPPYGIPSVVVHPSTDHQIKDRIRKLFLSLHKDPEARKILTRLQIDRFEPGNDSDYNSVREMQQWLDLQEGT